MEADFKTKPVLVGQRVVLRPFAEGDWKHMIDILEDRQSKLLTGSVTSDQDAERLMDATELDQVRDFYESRNQQNDRLDLAGIEKENGTLVGEVVFNQYDTNTGNVNFRILISPNDRNKGMGTEATALFIRYGFEVLKLHKIELEVFSFNPRAEHIYLKNGFVLEGVRRQNFKFNNQYFDTKLYGLLQSEYRVQL